MTDAAYFLGGGLPVEDRRAHEEELVRDYHDALLAHGVARVLVGGVLGRSTGASVPAASLMAVAPAMLVERTERGDEMFMAIARARYAEQVLDLDAARAAARAGRGRARAAAAGARRRGPPRAGARAAVERELVLRRGLRGRTARASTRGSGCYPNLGACLVHRLRLRPGRAGGRAGRSTSPRRCPTAQALAVDTATLRASIAACSRSSASASTSRAGRARTPITRRRCAARRGEPVDVASTWCGRPTASRTPTALATRYEIPCRVSGTRPMRRGDDRAERPRPARPLLGRARLVGGRVDVERPAPRRRHPLPRRQFRLPDAPARRRLRAAPTGELTELDAT